MSVKFYKCKTCGNVVVKVVDSGVTPLCCGHEMELLEANTMDSVGEKHLPAAAFVDWHTLHVRIGQQEHPMTQGHYIHLVAVETEDGLIIRHLKPDDKPDVRFFLGCARAVAIYDYCNLHGLWMIEAPKCCTI